MDELLARLADPAPPLARVDDLAVEPLAPRGERGFRILASASSGRPKATLSADAATCDDCVRELFDPNDRRHGYPFLNCTNCGPRLTIVTGLPNDRPHTTLVHLPALPSVPAEYEETGTGVSTPSRPPARFAGLSQPMELRRTWRAHQDLHDPIAWAFLDGSIEGRQIGALKGLGGYHLTCRRAQSSGRRDGFACRKHRDEKPFAVMVDDVGSPLEGPAEVGAEERELLRGRRDPMLDCPLASSEALARSPRQRRREPLCCTSRCPTRRCTIFSFAWPTEDAPGHHGSPP